MKPSEGPEKRKASKNPVKEVFLKRRVLLLDHYGIDLVLDVGANTGRYGREMRKHGYKGGIVSFEPLNEALIKLKEKAAEDPLWVVEECALGDREGEMLINISGNSVSSSILEMLPIIPEVVPRAAYVGTQKIRVKPLDAVFPKYWNSTSSVFLKIDTQGYEKRVLEGAMDSLRHIKGIQLEVSLVPLYEGETLLHEILPYALDLDYTLMSIEPGFHDSATGRLFQADLIFFKEGQ